VPAASHLQGKAIERRGIPGDSVVGISSLNSTFSSKVVCPPKSIYTEILTLSELCRSARAAAEHAITPGIVREGKFRIGAFCRGAESAIQLPSRVFALTSKRSGGKPARAWAARRLTSPGRGSGRGLGGFSRCAVPCGGRCRRWRVCVRRKALARSVALRADGKRARKARLLDTGVGGGHAAAIGIQRMRGAYRDAAAVGTYGREGYVHVDVWIAG